jgi:type IV pilus assembly protein PilB
MGVEPFLIANAINLVMAQRLVRTLCNHCKKPYDIAEIAQPAKNLGFSDEEVEEITFYQPVGCEKCNNGYDGRIAIMEALYFDDDIKRMIFDAGDEIDEDGLRKHAIKKGMLTLRASGRKRIKNGITTIEEVMAITIED